LVFRRTDLRDTFITILVHQSFVRKFKCICFLKRYCFSIWIPAGNSAAMPLIQSDPSFISQNFMIPRKAEPAGTVRSIELEHSMRPAVCANCVLHRRVFLHAALGELLPE